MSRAPTASALISTFVRDILHSLLILVHDFIGQRWPSSAIASFRTAPGRPRPPRQLPTAAPASCGLRVMQHGRPGQWDDYRDPVVVRLRELGIAPVYW